MEIKSKQTLLNLSLWYFSKHSLALLWYVVLYKICTLKIQKKIMSSTHIVKLPTYYTSTNMIHICSNLCTEVTTSILWGSIDRPGNNLNFMANSIKKEFELWINYWQFLWIHITSNRGRCTVMATWIKVT